MSPGSSHHHASLSSVMDEDITRIISPSRLSVLRYRGGFLQDPLIAMPLRPPLWRRMSPDPLTVMPLHPPLWRRMSPGFSHRHASLSSIMKEDVSRILSPSRLFVLCSGGECLQDPLTITPLRPPLWMRISPGSSHRHASSSSVREEDSPGSSQCHASSSSIMEKDVSMILSPSRLSVLSYGGGGLQDPLSVTPFHPRQLRRMSPGSSHRHASLSSIMEADFSRILSPSRLFVLCYGGGCLQDPLTVTPLCPPVFRTASHPIHGPMLEFKITHFEKCLHSMQSKIGI
jgi:hypothetical protein